MTFMKLAGSTVAGLGLVAGLALTVAVSQEAAPMVLPAATADGPKSPGHPQTAVVAGGCFWGMQGVFEHVRGVRGVVAGYAGGPARKAHYEDVETGATGHAESIEITFDPAEVSYGELLQIYFSVAHDPTQLNRQGPDSGPQYRSVIFYADDQQRRVAEAYIAQLTEAKSFPRPIVTRVEELKGFYPAEGYHQDYYLKNPHAPYIVFNDLPKIRALKQLFPDDYRDAPVMVGAR
jgi:peptide-methionine (S)-S-oxide reductase